MSLYNVLSKTCALSLSIGNVYGKLRLDRLTVEGRIRLDVCNIVRRAGGEAECAREHERAHQGKLV